MQVKEEDSASSCTEEEASEVDELRQIRLKKPDIHVQNVNPRIRDFAGAMAELRSRRTFSMAEDEEMEIHMSRTQNNSSTSTNSSNKRLFTISRLSPEEWTSDWILPKRYVDPIPLGSGAFGSVCSVLDRQTDERVAVKKISRIFINFNLAKRTFREFFILRNLRHKNVIGLRDAFLSNDEADVFLVTDLLPNDLRVAMKRERLAETQVRSVIYQLIEGLEYIHGKGVIHRDMKPENILVDLVSGVVKICDLGLARETDHTMTGYVTTRYYRAPEVMLSWQSYGPAVDLWSVGCILYELLTGEVLFPGIDHVQHLSLIFKLLGSPDDNLIDKMSCGETTKRFVKMLPKWEKCCLAQKWETRINNADAVELLERLLELDPTKRISAAQAKLHPYFADCRKESIECSTPVPSPSTVDTDGRLFQEYRIEELVKAAGSDETEWRRLIASEIDALRSPAK